MTPLRGGSCSDHTPKTNFSQKKLIKTVHHLTYRYNQSTTRTKRQNQRSYEGYDKLSKRTVIYQQKYEPGQKSK